MVCYYLLGVFHPSKLFQISLNYLRNRKHVPCFYLVLENSPKKARVLIGYKLCLYNAMETQN